MNRSFEIHHLKSTTARLSVRLRNVVLLASARFSPIPPHPNPQMCLPSKSLASTVPREALGVRRPAALWHPAADLSADGFPAPNLLRGMHPEIPSIPEPIARRPNIPPLPCGEGRGEGERSAGHFLPPRPGSYGARVTLSSARFSRFAPQSWLRRARTTWVPKVPHFDFQFIL
jgi:hypothetical protein